MSPHALRALEKHFNDTMVGDRAYFNVVEPGAYKLYNSRFYTSCLSRIGHAKERKGIQIYFKIGKSNQWVWSVAKG
jgi:hypothetical protein